MTNLSTSTRKLFRGFKNPAKSKFGKYFFAFLLMLCLAHNTKGQIASYNFNNNTKDQASTNHAVYIQQELPAATLPKYITQSGATSIVLGPIHGLSLPSSLRTAVDINKSLEIVFTFRVTDLGKGQGEKHLWTCSTGDNAPGFFVKIFRYEESADPNYDISFVYSDGGYEADVPNHPGHDATTIGSHKVGDLVKVRLILDFQDKTWTSIVNDKYTSKRFNSNFQYDWNILMNSLKKNSWFIGWTLGQNETAKSYPNLYTSTIELDDFQLFSPRKPANNTALQTALRAMTAHVNGTAPLTTAQLSTHLSTIYLNYYRNHSSVATQVFNFINAYESKYLPVYQNRRVLPDSKLSPEARLLVFLQQSIFDNEYVLANVAKLKGIKYEFAQLFPGPVKNTAPRVSAASVVVNGSHSYNPAARTVEDLTAAKRPTGYYAAPGEIVTITLPARAIKAGLQVQIGGHTADHSSLSETNRFKRITKNYALSAEKTQIVSPFGGGIYILVPLNASLNWVKIDISGAVKSPYFSWRIGRKTNPSVWAAELEAHQVEWADLESDNYMMTLPVAHLKQMGLKDPSDLMAQWENIIKGGFDYVGGRPATARKRSEYFIVDSRLPHDVFGVGYPQAMSESKAPFGPFEEKEYYPTQVLNPGFWNSGLNTTFHEMGHAAEHPTLPDEVESIVHLPAAYVYNQYYGLSIDEAFKYSSDEYFLLNDAAMDWMIARNFRTNKDMGCDPDMDPLVCEELRYQHRGFAKYVAMAKLFGWQSVHNMNKVFYNEWATAGKTSVVTKDKVLRAASNANGINMAPLFHFWGHAPSATLSTALKNLPTSPKIFSQLIEYYNLIPKDQSAFLPWKDLLLSRKDSVHHQRIKKVYAQYDAEKYATQMRNQVCKILQTYYPGNNFCASPTITTADDSFTNVAPGTSTPSVFKNDRAYGNIEATEDLVTTPTIIDGGGLGGVAFNKNGTLNIPINAANGVYKIKYRACLKNSLAVCAQATVTVKVTTAISPNANQGGPLVVKNGREASAAPASEVEDTNTKLLAYPNPVTDELTLKYYSEEEGGSLHIDVIDMSGVGQLNLKQTTRRGFNLIKLNVSQLQSGTYNIKLVQGNTITNTKIVKSK